MIGDFTYALTAGHLELEPKSSRNPIVIGATVICGGSTNEMRGRLLQWEPNRRTEWCSSRKPPERSRSSSNRPLICRRECGFYSESPIIHDSTGEKALITNKNATESGAHRYRRRGEGLAIDSCKMNKEIEAEGETEEKRGRSETERRGEERNQEIVAEEETKERRGGWRRGGKRRRRGEEGGWRRLAAVCVRAFGLGRGCVRF